MLRWPGVVGRLVRHFLGLSPAPLPKASVPDVDVFDPVRLEAARARLRAGKGIPFKAARDAIRGHR